MAERDRSRRFSIRFRVTALAVASVTIVLLAASTVLVTIQRSQLTANIDRALEQRGEDIAGLARSLDPIPIVLAGSRDEGFAQLVGDDGSVIAATQNLEGEPPLSLELGPGGGRAFHTIDGLDVDDDVFRVLTRGVVTPGGPAVLHVGTTFDVVNESIATLAGTLAVLAPVLVALVGGLVWWLVGTTLQPVEAIRSEVDEIGSGDFHRRVPVPPHADEIGRLASTMNRMLERVEASVDRQQRFIADASHELRSPLTRLRTEIDVSLAADSLDRATLVRLREEVAEIQRLVDDLLQLAALDAGGREAESQRVDLDDIVLEEARAARLQGGLDVDVSHVSGAEVLGDRRQLTRAIRNLCDNAQRHARHRVVLSLGETGGSAVFTITDDGPGIPASEIESIFDRFGRLDRSRTRATGGTGLGLAIAREIVERHGGTLQVDPTYHDGARFVLSVPGA